MNKSVSLIVFIYPTWSYAINSYFMEGKIDSQFFDNHYLNSLTFSAAAI